MLCKKGSDIVLGHVWVEVSDKNVVHKRFLSFISKGNHEAANSSLPLKLILAAGGEEICGTVPILPTTFDFSIRKFGASFDSFDHAVY